jgi:hypothetical protein
MSCCRDAVLQLQRFLSCALQRAIMEDGDMHGFLVRDGAE